MASSTLPPRRAATSTSSRVKFSLQPQPRQQAPTQPAPAPAPLSPAPTAAVVAGQVHFEFTFAFALPTSKVVFIVAAVAVFITLTVCHAHTQAHGQAATHLPHRPVAWILVVVVVAAAVCVCNASNFLLLFYCALLVDSAVVAPSHPAPNPACRLPPPPKFYALLPPLEQVLALSLKNKRIESKSKAIELTWRNGNQLPTTSAASHQPLPLPLHVPHPVPNGPFPHQSIGI